MFQMGGAFAFLIRSASVQATDQWHQLQYLLQECLRNADREQQYHHDRGWRSPRYLLRDDHCSQHLEMEEG